MVDPTVHQAGAKRGSVGSWRPWLRLGAASAGGLALPMALPTASQLYGPRGVWTDGQRVAVADTGNHRVLLWHRMPAVDGQPADVVLGQPDFASESPGAGGDLTRGLNLPTGVGVIAGQLVVADAWHHRLLVWRQWPDEHFAAPDLVLGQPDASSVLPNAGGRPTPGTMYWPFGFAHVAGTFWVVDTGNRRVLGWCGGLPEQPRPADVVLGQPTGFDREDNRGRIGPDSFRWPHALAGDDQTLWVADAGDHRVLGWVPPPQLDSPATMLLGQPDFSSNQEFKNAPQGPAKLRFPYGLAFGAGEFAVADTSNNRVLLWDCAPRAGLAVPADTVLGQPDFDANGENRWSGVTDDSFCWPYAVWLATGSAGPVLAVADSGNNRVMLWRKG